MLRTFIQASLLCFSLRLCTILFSICILEEKNKSSIDESSYVRVTYRGKFIKLRLRVYTIIRDSRVGNTNKVVRGAAKS